MSCCTAPAGFARRWQLIVGGTTLSEHDTQAEANAAKANNGGKGRVQRVTRKMSN